MMIVPATASMLLGAATSTQLTTLSTNSTTSDIFNSALVKQLSQALSLVLRSKPQLDDPSRHSLTVASEAIRLALAFPQNTNPSVKTDESVDSANSRAKGDDRSDNTKRKGGRRNIRRRYSRGSFSLSTRKQEPKRKYETESIRVKSEHPASRSSAKTSFSNEFSRRLSNLRRNSNLSIFKPENEDSNREYEAVGGPAMALAEFSLSRTASDDQTLQTTCYDSEIVSVSREVPSIARQAPPNSVVHPKEDTTVKLEQDRAPDPPLVTTSVFAQTKQTDSSIFVDSGPTSFPSAPPAEPEKSEKSLMAGTPSEKSSTVLGGEPVQTAPVSTNVLSPTREGKRRALLSATPYIELTLEESSTTLLSKIIGGRMFRRYVEPRDSWMVLLSTISFALCGMSGMFIYFRGSVAVASNEGFHSSGSLLYPPFTILAMCCSCLSAILYILSISYFINYFLVCRVLRSFDGLYLIFECIGYSIASWSFSCYSFPGFLVCCSQLVISSMGVLFEAMTMKHRTRRLLLIQIMCVMCFLGLLRLEVFKDSVCVYNFSFAGGVVRTDSLTNVTADDIAVPLTDSSSYARSIIYSSLDSPSTRWQQAAVVLDDMDVSPQASNNSSGGTAGFTLSSLKGIVSFSVYEFAFNRGLTVVIMGLKLIYSAYKRPHECLWVKSRTRFIIRD